MIYSMGFRPHDAKQSLITAIFIYNHASKLLVTSLPLFKEDIIFFVWVSVSRHGRITWYCAGLLRAYLSFRSARNTIKHSVPLGSPVQNRSPNLEIIESPARGAFNLNWVHTPLLCNED